MAISQIIGLVIGLGLIMVGIIIFVLMRKRKNNNFNLRKQKTFKNWFLDIIPITFFIAGIIVIIFIGIGV